MGVPHGASKSSILKGFSINHPFWGYPIYGNHHFDVAEPGPMRLRTYTKIGTLPAAPPKLATARNAWATVIGWYSTWGIDHALLWEDMGK